MHQSLYRKFRPTTFDGVIGQDHIITTLKNQIKSNEISHAYLFTGSRGTGKTTCAKIFSKAINCLNPIDGSPCGKCSVCEGLSSPNNTDILEIDAASNNRVDEIRELRERVKYPAIVGKRKVYIIDEVHMLTDSAFNALLKTLEEPPENVVFILATTELHKMPATILSRCMKFMFKLVPISILTEYLKTIFDLAEIKYDEESLNLIATAGEGSVRDALSVADAVSAFSNKNITLELTQQVLGKSNIDNLIPIVDSILNGSIQNIFISIEALKLEGKSIDNIYKDLLDMFKTLLLINSGIDDSDTLQLSNENILKLKNLVQSTSLDKLAYIFTTLSSIELDIKYSLSPITMLQSICVKASIIPNIENNFINTVDNNQTNNTNNITSKTIDDAEVSWGKVLIDAKSKNLFALSSACKSIVKVDYSNNILHLLTGDKQSILLLNDPERKEQLFSIAKKYFDKLKDIEIELDANEKSSDNIANDLKNLFNRGLKIID